MAYTLYSSQEANMVAESPANTDDQAIAAQDLQVQTAQAGSSQKIRVLIAKPGLDGHDRGAKIIARALRDAGMEVIYTGLHQTPEMIAEAALQEDVDAVGLSILSGAHMALFPRIMDELRKRGLDDVMVYAGGIIPDDDIPAIKEMGVAGVFGPGTPMADTVRFVRENVKPRLAEEE
jgi:methylmalonyl-CoA mutase C-terminal domain/subunit